jgi:hypothetical protein
MFRKQKALLSVSSPFAHAVDESHTNEFTYYILFVCDYSHSDKFFSLSGMLDSRLFQFGIFPALPLYFAPHLSWVFFLYTFDAPTHNSWGGPFQAASYLSTPSFIPFLNFFQPGLRLGFHLSNSLGGWLCCLCFNPFSECSIFHRLFYFLLLLSSMIRLSSTIRVPAS